MRSISCLAQRGFGILSLGRLPKLSQAGTSQGEQLLGGVLANGEVLATELGDQAGDFDSTLRRERVLRRAARRDSASASHHDAQASRRMRRPILSSLDVELCPWRPFSGEMRERILDREFRSSADNSASRSMRTGIASSSWTPPAPRVAGAH